MKNRARNYFLQKKWKQYRSLKDIEYPLTRKPIRALITVVILHVLLIILLILSYRDLRSSDWRIIASYLITMSTVLISCVFIRWSMPYALTKYVNYILTLRKEYDEMSIVGLMIIKRFSETCMLIFYIILGTTISSSAIYLINGTFPKHIASISFIAFILITIYFLSFLYRVREGLYGNNVREAREIVKFIESHTESTDTGGKGDGARRIHVAVKDKAEEGISPGIIGEGLRNVQ